MNKTTIYNLIALITIGLVVFFLFKNQQKTIVELKNRIVKMDTVIMEKDSSYSRLIRESVKKNDVLNFLKTENFQLYQQLQHQNVLLSVKTKVESVKVETTIKINDKMDLNSKTITEDTVYNDYDTLKTNPRYKIGFYWKLFPFKIYGYTLTNPPFAGLFFEQEQFNVFVDMSQDSNKMYRFGIKFTDIIGNPLSWKVNNIDGVIHSSEFSSDENYVGIGTGGLLSYDFLALGLKLDKNKNSFLFNYKLFENIKSDNWYKKFIIGYYRNF